LAGGSGKRSKENRRPDDWLGWLEVGTAPRAVLAREA
jgi:hypothetical protein